MTFLKIIQKYICEFILLCAVILLFTTRDTKIQHDKMIIADGLGYYSYLPAAFIYHDFSFSFFNPIYPKYYPPGYNPPTKNFINEFDGIKVNKYFPGVAILCLPFFLLAHFLSLLFGQTADGYSILYQYFIGLSAIFYCFLGLRYLKKILSKFDFSESIQTIAIASLFFGTNLLYQTVYYPSASHVYSFFLIAGLSYHLMMLFEDNGINRSKHLHYSMTFIAFVCITRPQNILILTLLPFFGATLPKIITIFQQAFANYKTWFHSIFTLIIVCIVPIIWYLQTGKLFFNPYHGEHYYFNNAHFFGALFSFRKGWLLFTPLMIVCLMGLFKLRNKMETLNVFLFFILIVFINSCWWSWTFGPTSFSQRAMVDFYIIPGILLAYFIRSIQTKTTFLYVIIVCISLLNILQSQQFRTGIIPGDVSSSETYFKNFFRIKPLAFYPIPKETIVNKQVNKNDYEKINFQNKDYQYVTNEHFSGNRSTFTCITNNFSASVKMPIPGFLLPNEYSKVRASALIKSRSPIGKCTMVLDFIKNGKSYSYNGFEIKNFIHTNNWEKVEFGLTLPENIKPIQDSMVIYFWDDKANDTTFIDDLQVEFITTNKNYELHP